MTLPLPLESPSSSTMSIVSLGALNTHKSIQTKVTELELLVGQRWLTAEQVQKIVFSFPAFEVQTRVSVARLLFPRIINLEDFATEIYDQLSESEQKLCAQTLGVLNILNPMCPDRRYVCCCCCCY